MPASHDPGDGRNPDPNAPDDGRMRRNGSPSEIPNAQDTTYPAFPEEHLSRDHSQRGPASWKLPCSPKLIRIDGMSYQASQEYLAKQQQSEDEMDMDRDLLDASSPAEKASQGSNGPEEAWTAVKPYRQRLLALKIRADEIDGETWADKHRDLLQWVAGANCNLAAAPIRFKHQDVEYYQVLPVGKEDYNTLRDTVLQGQSQ
ncbi:hypothetical protein BGZ51_002050 [Haplosporangium sp. Z 767]|nr:hypothetical protein BGZ50_008509 [Haplosporangium sp. Z 11]KAF9186406.1 hypothetical protein BGZ51_002050 [Haplosporangium sp. Z 767]